MFGAENVVDESSAGMDGETVKITAIYPAIPNAASRSPLPTPKSASAWCGRK